jgi:hypothetical protein
MEDKAVDDFGVDLDEVTRVIGRAKVLDVHFEIVAQSLLIDFRSAGTDQPFAVVLPKASSPRDRLRTIKSLRPSAPLPDRIMSFTWPRNVKTLAQAGLLAKIRDRISDTGADPAEVLGEAFQRLVTDEEALFRNAIRGGEGFQTVWERKT